MSIHSKRSCPPAIQTVLEIWQSTLVEARLSNAEAIAAASMLLGYVCLNVANTEDEAHDHFALNVRDIHDYIAANWHQAHAMKRAARSKRGE